MAGKGCLSDKSDCEIRKHQKPLALGGGVFRRAEFEFHVNIHVSIRI
jgi:hypothetical protein